MINDERTLEEKCKGNKEALPVSFSTICIDLNGVLDQYDGWRGDFRHYPIKPGAKEFLEQLKAEGWTLICHTSVPQIYAKDWLEANDLMQYFERVTDFKAPALIYLDDRGVTFTGDYQKALEDIRNFKVWWAKKGQTG